MCFFYVLLQIIILSCSRNIVSLISKHIVNDIRAFCACWLTGTAECNGFIVSVVTPFPAFPKQSNMSKWLLEKKLFMAKGRQLNTRLCESVISVIARCPKKDLYTLPGLPPSPHLCLPCTIRELLLLARWDSFSQTKFLIILCVNHVCFYPLTLLWNCIWKVSTGLLYNIYFQQHLFIFLNRPEMEK